MITAVIMLLVGGVLMIAAFKIVDAPDNPGLVWVFAVFVYFIAAFLIIQGTVIVLTGEWLL